MRSGVFLAGGMAIVSAWIHGWLGASRWRSTAGRGRCSSGRLLQGHEYPGRLVALDQESGPSSRLPLPRVSHPRKHSIIPFGLDELIQLQKDVADLRPGILVAQNVLHSRIVHL